jgi:hypothetical protein
VEVVLVFGADYVRAVGHIFLHFCAVFVVHCFEVHLVALGWEQGAGGQFWVYLPDPAHNRADLPGVLAPGAQRVDDDEGFGYYLLDLEGSDPPGD